MKFNPLIGLIGVATVSVLATSPARASVFVLQSGTTSINFGSNTLNSSIQFSPTTANASILPLGSIPGSTLRFDVTGSTITLLDGNIQTNGGSTNVSFDASTFPDAPPASNPFTVGNFTIAASGNNLSVIDNLTQGLTLFDVGNLSRTFNNGNLTLTGQLQVSSELNNRLYVYSSYDPNYSSKTGVRIGTIQINATTFPDGNANPNVPVPEPSTIASVLAVGAIFALRKCRQNGTPRVR